jgi:type III secretion protein J
MVFAFAGCAHRTWMEPHCLSVRAMMAMILSVFLTACGGGKVELLGNLPEKEANEVIGVLLNAAIDVQKVPGKDGMVSLEVERDSLARAIDVLQELGLPRRLHSKMGDVFKKENLISSPLEERARYLYALSQEMEHTLSKIDGVVAARVHIVLPERLGPGDPNLPSSASVFIKYRQGHGVENLVSQVRSLVANSVSGLSTEKVAVALFPSASLNTSAVVRWTDVLFFRVQESSAPALRILLGIMGTMCLLGLIASMYLMRQSGLLHAVLMRIRGRINATRRSTAGAGGQ